MSAFHVTSTDSDYTSVPTGYILGNFADFVANNELEIVEYTDDGATVRAEWGNGEGFDTYKIVFESTDETAKPETPRIKALRANIARLQREMDSLAFELAQALEEGTPPAFEATDKQLRGLRWLGSPNQVNGIGVSYPELKDETRLNLVEVAELRQAGLIERYSQEWRSDSMYRVTDAGRAYLQSKDE